MTDYGHPIEFGTFITPSNDPPETPVRLAQLSESLGYDLVTFQDHPYQPAFLDTWTLMSWVAGQTSRIRISANVHNLPLRPPAVLARAAASLDLLSGGRVELGLGAGGFWDAIEAMGGRRLTPGQGVDALDEAIRIIRGIWDAGERTPLRVDGEFYSVDGAKRGPAPAHDIPIGIGAYKPRMLRLTGRLGDGWLPSLPYLQPGDLQRGNEIIDEAATAAGRDPREIRRWMNLGGRLSATRTAPFQGPPEAWVDDAVALALDDGISTFIVMGDDPTTLERIAAEVIPAVREAVAAGRASNGTSSGAVRSAAARSARVDDIDYDAVPAGLAVGAIEPGDASYARVRNTYLRGGSPGLVLQVRTPDEVVEALAFAREQRVPLGVRSGGHGISGRSTNDGGIVLDLSRMRAIDVLDEGTRRIRVEAGARWADVATAIGPRGWALTSGDYGGVGVGGLATAGGVGWFAREQGLTIDHLRRVELVTADGRRVVASADEHPELFWALRGAGANFGIATAFEFEAHVGGDVGYAQLAFQVDDVAQFLVAYGSAIESAPRDLTAQVLFGGRRPGQPVVAQIGAMVHSDDPDTVLARLQPLAELGPLVDQSAQIVPYDAVMANVQDGYQNGQGQPHSRSGLLPHLTPEFGAAAAELLDSGSAGWFQLRAVGGAVADVAPDATAWADRAANFSLVSMGRPTPQFKRAWAPIAEQFSGLYLSFETGVSQAEVELAFPPATLERLRAVKAEWDPENVFRDNFSVAPAAASVDAD